MSRKLRNNYVDKTCARVTAINGDGTDASCAVRVCGALALTLRMSRVLGVAPLRMTRAPDGTCIARVSQEPNFYGYFLLFTLHACIISGLIMYPIRVATPFEFAKSLLELGFMGFISSVGVFGAHSRMKTIVNILNVIEKVHPQTRLDRGVSAVETKRCLALSLCVASVAVQIAGYAYWVVVLATATGGRTGEQDPTAYKRALFLYTLLATEVCAAALLQLQFLLVALLVGAALGQLNDSVHTLLYIIDMHSSPSVSVLATGLPDAMHVPAAWINSATDTLNITTHYKGKAPTKSNVPKMVSRLISSYGQMFDAVRALNDSFELIVLALLGSFLFYVVTTVHSLIIRLYEPEVAVLYIVMALFSTAGHLVHMVSGVEPAHKTDLELQRTRLLVTQLLSRAAICEQAGSFQLDLLYKQVQLNDVSYSPMGVCSLTRPLLIVIFGAATTFINIILQYRVLDKQN